MNAFIFTGGFSPDATAVKHFIKDFFLDPEEFKKDNIIILCDSGIDVFFEWKEKLEFKVEPSYAIGDMDSVSPLCLESLRGLKGCVLEEHSFYKDFSDTELALKKAIEVVGKNRGVITLIGGSGGRTDHLLQIIDGYSNGLYADIWLTRMQAVYYAKKNKKYCLQNITPSDIFSFSRTGKYFSKGFVKSKGLEWEGNLFRKKGVGSLSNRTKGFMTEEKISHVEFKCCGADFLVFTPFTVEFEVLK